MWILNTRMMISRVVGVPESVLSRAQELVEQLSDADITAAVKDLTMQKKPKAKPVHYDEVDMAQMSLFDTVQDDDIIKELSELDISNMTPMDALNTLYRFSYGLNTEAGNNLFLCKSNGLHQTLTGRHFLYNAWIDILFH